MMLLKEAFSAWKQRAAERVAVEEAQNAQINETINDIGSLNTKQ